MALKATLFDPSSKWRAALEKLRAVKHSNYMNETDVKKALAKSKFRPDLKVR